MTVIRAAYAKNLGRMTFRPLLDVADLCGPDEELYSVKVFNDERDAETLPWPLTEEPEGKVTLIGQSATVNWRSRQCRLALRIEYATRRGAQVWEVVEHIFPFRVEGAEDIPDKDWPLVRSVTIVEC